MRTRNSERHPALGPASLFGIAATAMLLATAPARAADPVTVRISDHFPAVHSVPNDLTKPWMERVTKLTDGKVTFRHFPSEQLVKQNEALRALQRSIVDMALVNPGFFPSELALSGASFLPLGYGTVAHGGRAMRAFHQHPTIRKEYEAAGCMPLLLVPFEPFEILTKKPVNLPQDMTGLKIRVAGEGPTDTAKALGAVPVSIAAQETYTSIQRGVLDGAFFPYANAGPYRLNEVTQFGTRNLKVVGGNANYCISTRFWDKLDPSYKAAMQKAADELLPPFWTKSDEITRATLAKFRAGGMTVVEFPDGSAALKQWEKALAPVRESWIRRMQDRKLPGREAAQAWEAALASTR